jgi:HlyD family secretion protein
VITTKGPRMSHPHPAHAPAAPCAGRSCRQAGLAVLLAALLLAACGQAAKNVSRYETAAVTRGEILDHVTASGSLSAVVSVDVGSQVSGKISHLFADYNSPVHKGQLVAEIDPTVYKAQLRQAEGDLASAESEVTLKQQNLARKKVLVPLKAASQLDLDQAVAELAQAQATVVIKEAALESARANLGYCTITAPVDGIVIARKVDEGQTVIAAMNTPVLFTVAQDITKMHITADVSEADIGQVHVGEPVDFTVEAFPNEVFHGEVHQVRMSPTTTQNVVTYQTIIAVNNPDKKLFPGMTADVSILVARRPDALRVPNAALRYAPPDDAVFAHPPPHQLARTQQLVYVLMPDGRTLEPHIVQVGITDGSATEASTGVTEGARVVTANRASPPVGVTVAGPPPPQN